MHSTIGALEWNVLGLLMGRFVNWWKKSFSWLSPPSTDTYLMISELIDFCICQSTSIFCLAILCHTMCNASLLSLLLCLNLFKMSPTSSSAYFSKVMVVLLMV